MKINRVPKASPDALPELAAFLEPFAPLFRRHTSRDSMERYLTGLLTDLPHKTADTIAAAVAGTSTERLPHLPTDAAWDAQTPAGLGSQPKPEVALGRLDLARQWGMPIQAVVVDAGYGDNPNLPFRVR